MKAVILCGGKGTRIRSGANDLPKVLFEIGGRPILWHLMKSFRAVGIREFVLCLGYRGDAIRAHFAPTFDAPADDTPLTVEDPQEDWVVTLVDTGEATNTGGRIFRASPVLTDDTFIVTYGDGLASIDLPALVRFHERHGHLGTVTAVRARSQFGLVSIGAEGQVRRFREKPPLRSWVNGGFFVFNRGFLDYLQDDVVLEDGPVTRLAKAGEMMAFRHGGFWACMDTYKDLQLLNDLWNQGKAAWKTWQ